MATGCARVGFRLDIRKKLLLAGMVKYWTGLRSEVVDSQSHEMFKKRGDVALKDMISGHTGEG